MKQIVREAAAALLMGLIVPGCLFRGTELYLESRGEPGETTQTEETVFHSVPLPVCLRQADGSVTEMDMDTYLVGAVLAEMPASFEPEALKAQAVAARTYARKAYETGGKHADGSVCTDSACCQAYIPEDKYLARGGTPEGVEKIREAVNATSGWVLTYEGALIEATYFSCSGGRTEDAAEVWGTDFPYLQAVDSPGEENAVHYTDTVSFTPEEFCGILEIHPEGSPRSWFGTPEYTAGGGVASIAIGGEVYSGTRLRSLLGLRSTAFSVSASDAGITITTRGYGHRVGMSQYGADAMAASGSTFEQILTYYYQGAELTCLDEQTGKTAAADPEG